MQTQRTGGGYLFNDNRAAGEGLQEADVIGCPHCQAVILWQQRAECGFCGPCGRPICAPCIPDYLAKGCTPFIKLVDRRLDQMARDRAYYRALGLVGGASVLQEGLP